MALPHPSVDARPSAASRGAGLKQFFAELKRRKVYRVAVAYIVAAWVLAQVATQVLPFFEVPNWTVRLIILALCLRIPDRRGSRLGVRHYPVRDQANG